MNDRAAAWEQIESAMMEESRGRELADVLCSLGWIFKNRGLQVQVHDAGGFLVPLPAPRDEAQGHAA